MYSVHVKPIPLNSTDSFWALQILLPTAVKKFPVVGDDDDDDAYNPKDKDTVRDNNEGQGGGIAIRKNEICNETPKKKNKYP